MPTQTDSHTILHWFYTNAPAAWLSAVVAITVLIVQLRKRPKRLVVREMPSVSFMHVLPALRGKITTIFEGRQINGLSMVVFELYNEGSETILDPAFTVTFGRDTKVLDAQLRPKDPDRVCHDTGDNRLNVTFPYINPFRDHKETLRLHVLADGETTHAKVSGSGNGWSVRYSPLPGPRQMRRWRRVQFFSLSMLFILILLYSKWIQRTFGIGINEVSVRSLVAFLPMLILGGAFVFFSDMMLKKIGKRTLRPIEQTEEQ